MQLDSVESNYLYDKFMESKVVEVMLESKEIKKLEELKKEWGARSIADVIQLLLKELFDE